MKGMMSAEVARQLAENAWVERAGREKGDLELTDFQKRAARKEFEIWWEREVQE